jgi:hypothetical protein
VTAEERLGQKVLIAIIAGTLLISATTIAASVALLGTGKLPTQLGRFLLTVGLMIWLYRGSTAAKWICVVLYGIAGFVGLLTVLSDHRAVRMIVHMGTVYLTVVSVLVTSRSANAFLRYQRERRIRPVDYE